MILLCKLLLAPGFVVAISMAVRRFGPRIGGLLGGLPVVAGPILFIYALDHGTRFAADAARNSLAALVALTTFALVVVLVSPWVGAQPGVEPDGARGTTRSLGGRGKAAVVSVIAGWVAFCLVAATVAAIDLPPVLGLIASCMAFAVGLAVLPHADPHEVAALPQRPPFDLALRAGVAAVMVLALTSIAGQLGPAASGVLAPFPTITSVLIGFAVAHETRATTLHLTRGMLRGFVSFATALFVIAVTLEPWGVAPAFLAAIAATTVVQLALLTLLGRAATPVVAVRVGEPDELVAVAALDGG